MSREFSCLLSTSKRSVRSYHFPPWSRRALLLDTEPISSLARFARTSLLPQCCPWIILAPKIRRSSTCPRRIPPYQCSRVQPSSILSPLSNSSTSNSSHPLGLCISIDQTEGSYPGLSYPGVPYTRGWATTSNPPKRMGSLRRSSPRWTTLPGHTVSGLLAPTFGHRPPTPCFENCCCSRTRSRELSTTWKRLAATERGKSGRRDAR